MGMERKKVMSNSKKNSCPKHGTKAWENGQCLICAKSDDESPPKQEEEVIVLDCDICEGCGEKECRYYSEKPWECSAPNPLPWEEREGKLLCWSCVNAYTNDVMRKAYFWREIKGYLEAGGTEFSELDEEAREGIKTFEEFKKWFDKIPLIGKEKYRLEEFCEKLLKAAKDKYNQKADFYFQLIQDYQSQYPEVDRMCCDNCRKNYQINPHWDNRLRKNCQGRFWKKPSSSDIYFICLTCWPWNTSPPSLNQKPQWKKWGEQKFSELNNYKYQSSSKYYIQSKENNSTNLLIVGGIVVLGLGILIGWLVTRKNKRKNAN